MLFKMAQTWENLGHERIAQLALKKRLALLDDVPEELPTPNGDAAKG